MFNPIRLFLIEFSGVRRLPPARLQGGCAAQLRHPPHPLLGTHIPQPRRQQGWGRLRTVELRLSRQFQSQPFRLDLYEETVQF